MMDRARGRSSGGPVSAPRRPRTTGFKDSPVHDEDEAGDEVHNSRLRERIKKDTLVSVMSSSSSGAALRNKRKRQELPAPQPQPQSHQQQHQQQQQQHAAAHSSAADEAEESSDESDGAATEDDDDPPPPPPPPPPIPRWPAKPRPAKFGEEGIGLDLPAVPRKARSAIAKRQHESHSINASSTPPHHHSTSAPTPAPAPASYNTAAKPGRRMKPNGSKPRPSKVPKSSPAPISEQEVEVAEALFDLARMVPNFHKSEGKSESKADRVSSASPARVASPAATPLTPPVSQNNAHAPPSTSHPAEAPRRKRPRLRPRSDEGGSSRAVAAGGLKAEHEQASRKVENSKLSGVSCAPPVPSVMATAAGSSSQTFSEPCDSLLKKPENAAAEAKPSVAERKGEAVNADLNKRKMPSSDSRPAKLEIDLMALPLQNDSAECNAEFDRKEPMELQGGSTTELYWLDKERDRLKEREKEHKDKEDQQEDNDAKKDADGHLKEERECLDLNKQGMGALRSSKSVKTDTKINQKPDRSVSAAVVSAASSFLNATTSACNTTPTMTNWPGYYAPPPAAVAAAAAQAAVLTATSTEENSNQVMPYLTSRQSWKRCAIHVFIARFIDLQQQMKRHTMMAATLSYAGKPYNLNIPADAVFGNAANVASSNATGSTVSPGLALGERNAQPKSGPYMDAMFRKHPAQQQHAQAPAFGFPVSQGMTTNASGSAGSVSLSSAGTGSGGNSTSAGTGNSSVASMAAQAQFFQAVMQHNPFPFPFPTSHFASHNFNGAQNIGQQAAQFVNNPFYASHMVQQQGQAASNVISGSSQKPQGGRMFTGLGSGQPQQLGEKDSACREAGENKMLQRLIFAQQPASNGGPNLNAPAVLGTDGSHTGKLQQNSGAPSQLQHGVQMSLNPQQSSQNANGSTAAGRGVGPGPLGLAPVAAVMAPQGHAVLQSMGDPGRLHPHGQAQSHLHAMQSGHQARPMEIYEGNNADGKLAKRNTPIPRVDLETLPTMQAASPNGSSSRIGNAAMNLLPAASVSARLHQSQSGASSPVQSSNQNMKQPANGLRAKTALSTASPAPVTSFVDRNSMSRGGSAQVASFPAQAGLQTMQAAKLYQAPAPPQHSQLKLSQRPATVAPGPGVPANPASISKSQVQPVRSPQASSPAPRISSAPASSSVSAAQAPKQGGVNQKNVMKGSSFPLSQKPGAAPVVSGKRPATAGNSPMQNASSTSQNQPAKVMQPQQPLSQASSPQHSAGQQYQAHLNQQQVSQIQKQASLPQIRQPQMFLQQQFLQQPLMTQQQGLLQQQLHPQQQAQLQGSSSPSANGLSLASQGLSLGSSSNGTPGKTAMMDGSFSQAMMSKSAAPSTRTPSGSPVTSQRVNGTSMPVLQQHQTGSPNSNQQQQSSPFPAGYVSAVKSSEPKNGLQDVSAEQANRSSVPSSPLKTSSTGFSSQAPGRQPQQGKVVNYGDSGVIVQRAAAGPAGGTPTAAGPTTNSDVRLNFANAPQQQQQQQQQQLQPQQQQQQQLTGSGVGISPVSTMSSLVAATPIAVAAAAASGGGGSGLLGQSSASALRP